MSVVNCYSTNDCSSLLNPFWFENYQKRMVNVKTVFCKPFQVIDDNGDEEVDEDKVLQDNESNKIDEDMPVVRVLLLNFRVHQEPVV